ncbi:MAG: hypothetical protein ACRDYE_06960 [Acidimicrobiales bacterium]
MAAAIPDPVRAAMPDPGPAVDPGAGPATRVGQAMATGQNLNIRDLADRAGLSANAISANDLVGALGGALVFISFFVATATSPDGSASLSSDGGFIGALVPIFAGVATIALVVPNVSRFAPIWLALSGVAMGIGVGARAFLSELSTLGVSYGAGWFLCLIGGLLLLYGWIMRIGIPRA